MELAKHETHLLIGASGAGKTTLALQIIKANEQGQELIVGLPGRRIAYVTSDRHGRGVQQHIRTLGIKSVHHYSLVEDRMVTETLLRNRTMLTSYVIQRLPKGFDVLILDPMALFLPPTLNVYHDAAFGLTLLNRLALDLKITILGIHHSVKIRQDDDFLRPQDRISGSAALQAFSSSQVILIQGQEKKKVWDDVFVIHHNAPEEHYKLARDDDGYFVFYDGVVERAAREKPQRAMIAYFISNMPEEFERAVLMDTAEAAGISEKTVKRCLADLISRGALTRVGHGKYKKVKDFGEQPEDEVPATASLVQ